MNIRLTQLAILTIGSLHLLILSGCSIAMALNGHAEPNFANVKVGAAREEVEFELGQPVSTKDIGNGKREMTYRYEMGNSPNPARATIYGYYDLVFIGLSEPVFTLIEIFQGRDEETQVVYGENTRVVEIKGYEPPPISPELKAAQEEQEKFMRKRPVVTINETAVSSQQRPNKELTSSY